MDVEVALDSVRRRINLLEARLKKPLDSVAKTADLSILVALEKEEERLRALSSRLRKKV